MLRADGFVRLQMKMKIPTGLNNGCYGYGEGFVDGATLAGENAGGNGTGNVAVTNSGGSSSIDECESPESVDGDFSEYLWMENEEEFDKQVMQQLEEEALMEQCIEAMLEDELASHQLDSQWGGNAGGSVTDICNQMNNLRVNNPELAKSSKLNPLAAEFVPAASCRPPVESAVTA